jgi:hypothetical protein
MTRVEPVPGEPAATVALPDEQALVVGDYHAGLEVALRAEGVELDSQADDRRERLLSLLDRTLAEHVIVLGDLEHSIGDPGWEETDELEALLEAVTDRAELTIVKGNHDGEVEALVSDAGFSDVTVTPTHGTRIGDVGFAHGHTWPRPEVLGADVLCVGHEHPVVRLEDEVGGRRIERVWLRGGLNSEPFRGFFGDDIEFAVDPELVVFPAYNDLVGGTWVNVEGQEFLAPFLPEGLDDGEAYLLDGTRLGAYQAV